MNEPSEIMNELKYKLPAGRHFTFHAFHPKAVNDSKTYRQVF